LKNPHFGGISLPSAIRLISDSFTKVTRTVARGVPDLSPGYVVELIPANVVWHAGSRSLCVGDVTVKQYHVVLNMLLLSPSRAFKWMKLVPKIELVTCRQACNTWYRSLGGNQRMTTPL
jgi:hypothetical protein